MERALDERSYDAPLSQRSAAELALAHRRREGLSIATEDLLKPRADPPLVGEFPLPLEQRSYSGNLRLGSEPEPRLEHLVVVLNRTPRGRLAEQGDVEAALLRRHPNHPREQIRDWQWKRAAIGGKHVHAASPRSSTSWPRRCAAISQ